MGKKGRKSVGREIREIPLRSRVKQKIFMERHRKTDWDESLTQSRSSPPFFITQYSEETEEKIWIISSERFFMIKGSDMKKIENYSGMISGRHDLWLFIRQTNLNLTGSEGILLFFSCNDFLRYSTQPESGLFRRVVTGFLLGILLAIRIIMQIEVQGAKGSTFNLGPKYNFCARYKEHSCLFPPTKKVYLYK